MKKLLVAVAMVLGMGTTVAFAQEVKDSIAVEVSATPVEFVKVEVKSFPQEVADALAKGYEGATVKEAFVAAKPEGKVYKIFIITKDAQEVIVLFNEKGEVVTE